MERLSGGGGGAEWLDAGFCVVESTVRGVVLVDKLCKRQGITLHGGAW